MRVTIPEGVFAERVGDETVLLELGTGQYFGLNPTATRFWQLLGELGDTTRVLEVAAREYEVSSQRLSADLEALVAELVARHLLVPEPDK